MRPYAFVVGPFRFFQPRLRKCVWRSYRTFINGFAKKALAELYGSYDKTEYVLCSLKLLPLKGKIIFEPPLSIEILVPFSGVIFLENFHM